MIKRIIVEGADQQGKSTLCKFLAAQLGWKVVHFAKPDENFDFVKGYMLDDNTISDRNFVSELVYSRVNDKKSRAQRELLANLFRTSDTLLIMVDRRSEFVFDAKRHEDYTEEQISKARMYYAYEYDMIRMHKVTFNPNRDSEVELLKYINEW